MMKKSIEKTRDAYLPMSLLHDGDLDLINSSNLSGFHRDIAVMYFMAQKLVDSTQITVRTFTACDDADMRAKDLEHLEPLAQFLRENGKAEISKNLQEAK